MNDFLLGDSTLFINFLLGDLFINFLMDSTLFIIFLLGDDVFFWAICLLIFFWAMTFLLGDLFINFLMGDDAQQKINKQSGIHRPKENHSLCLWDLKGKSSTSKDYIITRFATFTSQIENQ